MDGTAEVILITSYFLQCFRICLEDKENKQFKTNRAYRFLQMSNVLPLFPISHGISFMVGFFLFRSSRPEVFSKKGVLGHFAKFTGKHLCQSLFFNKVAGQANFIKKETLAQVFSCEFCEISKNTFSYRTPPVAASVFCRKEKYLCTSSARISSSCKHNIFILYISKG